MSLSAPGLMPGMSTGMPMSYPANKKAEDRLNQLRKSSYQEIMGHEQAHQLRAGPYGGGIVMEYDNNGIAIGGHVPISIPPLNAQNPAQSYQAYRMISDAALAPDKPSATDQGVALNAQSLMGQAQVLMNQKQRQPV